jgi:SAM-dependent methyltransferase
MALPSLVDMPLLADSPGERRTIRAAHRWYEHLIALWAPGLIEAAHDLGVYECLADRPRTGSEVAATLGTDPRATRIMLEGLCAYELLERAASPRGDDGDPVYVLAQETAECLLPGGVYSLAGKIAYDRRLAWGAWRNLAAAVRTGSYTDSGSDRLNQISEHDYEELVGGINFWAPPVISILAEELVAQGWSTGPYRMLDVGCGTGLYGQLLAKRIPSLQVTGLDVDRIAPIAVAQAESLGVGDRFHTAVLDFQHDDWGQDFDLVFFANIFHLQTPESAARLAQKAAAAVASGGLVAIADHIVTDDREGRSTQDRFFRLFAASMLATGGGDAYRLDEYDRWLTDVGLKRVALLDTPMHRILLAAPTGK